MALTSGAYWVTANTSSKERAQALLFLKPPVHLGTASLRSLSLPPEPGGCSQQQTTPLRCWETRRTLVKLCRRSPGLAEPLWGGDWGVPPSFGLVSGCLVRLPRLQAPSRSERTHTSRAGYCRNEISTGRECNPRAN